MRCLCFRRTLVKDELQNKEQCGLQGSLFVTITKRNNSLTFVTCTYLPSPSTYIMTERNLNHINSWYIIVINPYPDLFLESLFNI